MTGNLFLPVRREQVKSRGGVVLRFDGVGIKTSTEVFLSPATTYSSLRCVHGASPSPHTRRSNGTIPSKARKNRSSGLHRESRADFTRRNGTTNGERVAAEMQQKPPIFGDNNLAVAGSSVATCAQPRETPALRHPCLDPSVGWLNQETTNCTTEKEAVSMTRAPHKLHQGAITQLFPRQRHPEVRRDVS